VTRSGGASTRGEGASPTAEPADLGGAKGQESIGSIARLTARTRVRTLGRSNALKSQAQACGRALPPIFREPVALSWALRVDPPLAASAARSLPRHFGGVANELMLEHIIGVTRANISVSSGEREADRSIRKRG
jgi:hypothetical protein